MHTLCMWHTLCSRDADADLVMLFIVFSPQNFQRTAISYLSNIWAACSRITPGYQRLSSWKCWNGTFYINKCPCCLYAMHQSLQLFSCLSIITEQSAITDSYLAGKTEIFICSYCASGYVYDHCSITGRSLLTYSGARVYWDQLKVYPVHCTVRENYSTINGLIYLCVKETD